MTLRTSRLRLRKTVLREVSQIYEAVTIRLFPNKAQSRKLWENAGAARWIWNWGLSLNNELYAREKRILSMYDMRREFIKMRNGSSHQWLMKCAVKTEDITQKMPLRNVNIGIDLGVKVLAVISCEGHKRVFRNINRSHRMRRLNRQLKHYQRALSRKQKGSNNRLKARRKVQKIHGRLRRIRHNYIHQTTRAIVNMRPKAIVLEDLNISGMMKNEHLAKSIAEQNLYLFRELLERKAHEAGITVIHAGRFYPSSKTCSQCGHVKAELPLSERTYKCPECGLIIDRDFNAARNLEKLAC